MIIVAAHDTAVTFEFSPPTIKSINIMDRELEAGGLCRAFMSRTSRCSPDPANHKSMDFKQIIPLDDSEANHERDS